MVPLDCIVCCSRIQRLHGNVWQKLPIPRNRRYLRALQVRLDTWRCIVRRFIFNHEREHHYPRVPPFYTHPPFDINFKQGIKQCIKNVHRYTMKRRFGYIHCNCYQSRYIFTHDKNTFSIIVAFRSPPIMAQRHDSPDQLMAWHTDLYTGFEETHSASFNVCLEYQWRKRASLSDYSLHKTGFAN